MAKAKTAQASQWAEALDLVAQGKGVWGEHPQIGEVVLRPDPTDPSYFGFVYPGRQGTINGVLSVTVYAIAAKRTADVPFVILHIYDDPDEAAEAICAVMDWNLQRGNMEGQQGYRYTRQAIPAVPRYEEPNISLRWDKQLRMQHQHITWDALPAIRRRWA